MTTEEIELCHNVIDRQRKMHQKLFAELKSLKTVLEVPKFRDQIPKINLHGTDFNHFTKTLGQIYKDTVTHLVDKAGVPVGSVFNDDEMLALSAKKKKVAEDRENASPSPSRKRIAQKS